ncbi:MAG: hypothetical protein ACFCBU_02025 [Cyanophyceae cyanobacterium]
MSKIISTISVVSVTLSAIALPRQPARASDQSQCKAAIHTMVQETQQQHGVNINELITFDSTAIGYSLIVDNDGNQRKMGYSFFLEVDNNSEAFINSPLIMKGYAQKVADSCRSLSMISFIAYSESRWNKTSTNEMFGVDDDAELFKFRCVSANSPEANQTPMPWGVRVCR